VAEIRWPVRHILDEKVVLISGGASGIGRAAALTMAKTGATVIVAGHKLADCESAATEIRMSGGDATAIEIDVSSRASIHGGVGSVVERFGRIDVLFNPAGILRQASITDCSADDWDAVLAVHAGGHADIIEAVVPVMRRAGGGRIITVSSGAAIDGIGELCAYTTAKSAILGLTRSLARSLAADSIMINAISPTAYTSMSRDVPPGSESPIPARYRRRGPEEVAAFVTFLASDLADSVTGRLFMVSGGHVIEFDAPRPLKLMQLPADSAGADVDDELHWILRRPTAGAIGRRPTRDYFFLPEGSAADDSSNTSHARITGKVHVAGGSGPVADAVYGCLNGMGLSPTAVLGADVVAGIVFCAQPQGETDDTSGTAWIKLQPEIRRTFLAVQNLARLLAERRHGGIVIVLPPFARTDEGLVGNVLIPTLIGLARSAASTLGKSSIAVHAIHAPASAADARLFTELCAALIGGRTDTPSGSLFNVSAGHIVSFAYETPAWQHFSDGMLTNAWLAAIAEVVRSRGHHWAPVIG
jgi:3-oxoacyl-[acyl-carrier protein] reductase